MYAPLHNYFLLKDQQAAMEWQAQGVKDERAAFAFARLTDDILPGFAKHPCNLEVYISVDHFATCFHYRFHYKRKKKP
jgi:hypothetical protein